MNILVTGGCGFIGSNLCTCLASSLPDSNIIALDNFYRRGSEINRHRLAEHGIQVLWGDVRDPSTFPNGDVDVLIECSAEPSVLAGTASTPDYLFRTNVDGAYNCLEYARRRHALFIFLSTSRVYPIAPLENHPWIETASRFEWLDIPHATLSQQGVREETSMHGYRSLYGATKLAAELLITEYREAYGLRTIVNRCGVIAGPWQFGKVDQGIVAHWVIAHHFQNPLKYIGYGGAGKQVRDILHIQDLSTLIVEQVQSSDEWEGWEGNVAGGYSNSISLQELTSLTQKITGNTIPIRPEPTTRPNDLRIFIADCARLDNFRTSIPQPATRFPQKNIQEIVSDTHQWVRNNEKDLRTIAIG